jgi:hypothetical protein
MRGGIEAIYDDVPQPLGMLAFAPVVKPKGGMFSARRRIVATGAGDNLAGSIEPDAVVPEAQLAEWAERQHS